MKPFNLQKALAGEPVVTRDGLKVTEVTHFSTAQNPINTAAVVHFPDRKAAMLCFAATGSFLGCEQDTHVLDLFMAERTVRIGDIDVPEPLREIAEGRIVYRASIYSAGTTPALECIYAPRAVPEHLIALRNGLLFATPEAAQAMTQALTTITRNALND